MKHRHKKGRPTKEKPRERRNRPAGQKRLRTGVLRTVKQYFTASRQFQDIWDRVVQVPGLIRTRGLSLKQASKQFGLSASTVLRLAGSAFRKRSNGRFVAKSVDRLLRRLVLPSKKGLSEIFVNDSREASIVGHYWSAVERYRSIGDASELQKFSKKRVRDVNGKRILLLTDLNELDRQASGGQLGFESLYGRTT